MGGFISIFNICKHMPSADVFIHFSNSDELVKEHGLSKVIFKVFSYILDCIPKRKINELKW